MTVAVTVAVRGKEMSCRTDTRRHTECEDLASDTCKLILSANPPRKSDDAKKDRKVKTANEEKKRTLKGIMRLEQPNMGWLHGKMFHKRHVFLFWRETLVHTRRQESVPDSQQPFSILGS